VPQHVRVFVSSPGDVGDERAAAIKLISEYDRRPWLRGRITTEVVAYDDPLAPTPMDATRPPQDSVIAYNAMPSKCDLTVIILFGRLGTPLPPPYVQADGTPYESGTHYEYEDARRHGKPFWIFHRKRFLLDPEDPNFDSKMAQFRALKGFLSRFTSADQKLLGGITEYESPADFTDLLSKHLETELRRILGDPKEHDPGFKIFLANTADDLTNWRGRLRSQLDGVPGVSLLTELPPPFDAETHRLVADEIAKQADLSVHFLGKSPGAGINENDDQSTYPMEQLRACLDHGRSRLILHPDGFRPESLEQGPYRTLVEEAHGLKDDRSRLEIVTTKREVAAATVLEKRRFILRERERSVQDHMVGHGHPRARTMFVDVHDHDADHIDPLLKFLSNRITLASNPAGELRGPTQKAFEEIVSQTEYLLVVFGKVACEWVSGRLEEAVKIAVERGHMLKLGIYVRPSASPWPSKPGPPIYTTLIDNSAGFDAAPIQRFLGTP
jgi:hypothetical protein